MQRCRASLISLACYSGVIPLKFRMNIESLQLSTLEAFVTIMNNSLHSTTMIDEVRKRRPDYFGGDSMHHSSSYRSSLSHALKRGVSSLRKSQSLNDLSTSSHDCLDYYQSCPDLLEMQSLHNMHPKLHNGLRCDKFYLNKHFGREIKLKNYYKRFIRKIELKNHYKIHQRYKFWFKGLLYIIKWFIIVESRNTVYAHYYLFSVSLTTT